jgi:Tfp pilus assembly protein PilN
MTDCCELLRQALYVIVVAFGVILALLAMFFGYSLRLDKRTIKLEKKNGHESDRIAKLEARNKQIDELKKAVEQLKRGTKN